MIVPFLLNQNLISTTIRPSDSVNISSDPIYELYFFATRAILKRTYSLSEWHPFPGTYRMASTQTLFSMSYHLGLKSAIIVGGKRNQCW